MKSVLNIHWEDWCWNWNSSSLAIWLEELTHLKRPWCWERLKVGREGYGRGWHGWMASPTQWTWVWVNSGSWWWTGMPGLLQSMGSQRVRDKWVTKLNWNCEDNGDLLQKAHACTATLGPPPLQQATTDPCLHWRLLDTHRWVWVSVLWGHFFFLLGPGAHKVLFVTSMHLFPQSCVSSGGSVVWLIVTSSKTAYAIPRSIAPRAPAPVAGHCWPVPPQETLKHSKPGLV